MAKPSKTSEGAKQLAEAEAKAHERFEKATNDIREGAYQFAQRVRAETELVLEEFIDPAGDVVRSVADVEGDSGAIALALPLEMLTFDTWLFGQVGDKDELDLKDSTHFTIWFQFGAWLGETLRRRHGGHWLLLGEDPHLWRLGFSKVFLEIAPFVFAEQLIRSGSGALQKMITEIERLRLQHEEAAAADNGKAVDRFAAQHYIRMHSVPLGQWLSMDFATLTRMWNTAPVSELIAAVKAGGARLPPQNAPVVARVLEALGKAKQAEPIAKQTGDRGLFEAVAQMISLRRATPPIAVDILERVIIPALHVGLPQGFPPLDEDDISELHKGKELFAFFVDVVPHKFNADDEGFLGSIPREDLASPYADRTTLEVGKGDWIIVNPRHFLPMLGEFDAGKLLGKYDEFVAYVGSQPEAPRRRDDGRMLAETAVRALTELKACVQAAAQHKDALVFRMLPPPG